MLAVAPLDHLRTHRKDGAAVTVPVRLQPPPCFASSVETVAKLKVADPRTSRSAQATHAEQRRCGPGPMGAPPSPQFRLLPAWHVHLQLLTIEQTPKYRLKTSPLHLAFC